MCQYQVAFSKNGMKKTVWNTILKVVIAVASAIAGVIGGQAMTF